MITERSALLASFHSNSAWFCLGSIIIESLSFKQALIRFSLLLWLALVDFYKQRTSFNPIIISPSFFCKKSSLSSLTIYVKVIFNLHQEKAEIKNIFEGIYLQIVSILLRMILEAEPVSHWEILIVCWKLIGKLFSCLILGTINIFW